MVRKPPKYIAERKEKYPSLPKGGDPEDYDIPVTDYNDLVDKYNRLVERSNVKAKDYCAIWAMVQKLKTEIKRLREKNE